MRRSSRANDMASSFFSLIFREKYIRRWGLMRNTSEENLSSHSMEVAMIAHALALIGNEIYGKQYDEGAVMAAALYHDATEVFTGDMPTPVKYFSREMRENYKVVERQAVDQLIDKLPEKLKPAYKALLDCPNEDVERLVKIADKLAAYIKCAEEEKCGNGEFRSAKDSTMKSLENYKCPELDYFIKEFLPAFSLTLDEM